jgi:hypothetical protein
MDAGETDGAMDAGGTEGMDAGGTGGSMDAGGTGGASGGAGGAGGASGASGSGADAAVVDDCTSSPRGTPCSHPPAPCPDPLTPQCVGSGIDVCACLI